MSQRGERVLLFAGPDHRKVPKCVHVSVRKARSLGGRAFLFFVLEWLAVQRRRIAVGGAALRSA
jgi:hypothetical protein